MHPDIARCRDGLRSAVARLSPDVAERARDGKWSIAQTLEHLDLAYILNTAGLEHRLLKGTVTTSPRTLRHRIGRFVVVGLGHFPAGRKSPESVVPQGRPFAAVSTEMDAHLVALDERLSEAERAFGAKRPVLDHPILGPFSVADWRRFHWIHTRHHLRQFKI